MNNSQPEFWLPALKTGQNSGVDFIALTAEKRNNKGTNGPHVTNIKPFVK